jgi:hypothetical protein
MCHCAWHSVTAWDQPLKPSPLKPRQPATRSTTVDGNSSHKQHTQRQCPGNTAQLQPHLIDNCPKTYDSGWRTQSTSSTHCGSVLGTPRSCSRTTQDNCQKSYHGRWRTQSTRRAAAVSRQHHAAAAAPTRQQSQAPPHQTANGKLDPQAARTEAEAVSWQHRAAAAARNTSNPKQSTSVVVQ